ncbi:hypothetical protein CI102_3373 [Trichoderma harzianum]|nr:hypothetical protein CI102_3373 [Trichoderma harzianum]
MQMSEKIDDDRIAKPIHAKKLTPSISKKHSTPEWKITRRRKKSINILTITSYYLLSTGLSQASQMYFFSQFSHLSRYRPRLSCLAQPASLIPEAKVY